MKFKTGLSLNSRLGVMGSGQLGRMFTQSASAMGFRVKVYSPDSDTPSKFAGAEEFTGNYEDAETVWKFLSETDALTFEFENIPEKCLSAIDDYCRNVRAIPVCPSTDSIRISQNRIKEKTYFNSIGLKTAPFIPVNSESSREVLGKFNYPAILKTNTFGYDGKGQTKFSSSEDLFRFLSEHSQTEFILEEKISFDAEISVIGSRTENGEIFCYKASENLHENHILSKTVHPANMDESLLKKAEELTAVLLNSLKYVGVLGLEFFVRGNELLCNEFAPRPHNSGHFSMDSGFCSQFDLQLFSLVFESLPFRPKDSSPCIMYNIIGEEFYRSPDSWIRDRAQGDEWRLHLYQKNLPRPGRKMGHLNVLRKHS
ncbi:MAG TPA: 5-(carboxyamino)imidazole ribonucleotide synthase [Leptospiraceae bacterium]|nr:5-(carboxyamino)imidazole ribonucleotide synthase [Leptospiraceae bacterium]HMY68013.1 5-(carboxyamino)imidazole ribonucleotide synthase [Leptospiraceae bacterium]HNF14059.1 5-(carboxyamino)imidazole ribonucleotide synthase [Leptospiraceae bacterium]HNI95869.1 5-(carboxyamino)imidazole ribonucleotide synthase [Leptospiraceae bacterium]HNN06691.1 5-(carboxyamino)imidazole ribonucleotide synthase [Leptospiraceae bacterium]